MGTIIIKPEDNILLPTKEYLKSRPLPKATKSYAPLSHGQVIDMTLEALDKEGLKVIHENYKSAREGKQANGFYTIGGGDSEMNIQLQWINSYDKSIPLGWAIGANVTVCKNGMVAGDLGRFKRKHTGSIKTEFEEGVRLYVAKTGEMFEKLTADREKMKNIELTKRACAELTGRMHIEENLITATQLGIIKKELANPSFDYNADGSVWEFYNHNTLALKEAHPQHSLTQHMDLHKFFVKEFAL